MTNPQIPLITYNLSKLWSKKWTSRTHLMTIGISWGRCISSTTVPSSEMLKWTISSLKCLSSSSLSRFSLEKKKPCCSDLKDNICKHRKRKPLSGCRNHIPLALLCSSEKVIYSWLFLMLMTRAFGGCEMNPIKEQECLTVRLWHLSDSWSNMCIPPFSVRTEMRLPQRYHQHPLWI